MIWEKDIVREFWDKEGEMEFWEKKDERFLILGESEGILKERDSDGILTVKEYEEILRMQGNMREFWEECQRELWENGMFIGILRLGRWDGFLKVGGW